MPESESSFSSGVRPHLLPSIVLGLFIMSFGALGIYLISGGQSLRPSVSLSLAPSNATIRKGQIINVAVNIDSKDQPVKAAEALVNYPSTLQLSTVQDVCPKDTFNSTNKNTAGAGVVDVACGSVTGVSGAKTLAMLTFKALADSSNAGITIASSSSATLKADGRKATTVAKNATMTLTSASLSAKKTVMPQQVTPGKPASCATPGPGRIRCHSFITSPQPAPHATLDAVSGYGPSAWHNGYQLPCTPGGAVQSVCPQPTTFGPATVAIVDAYGYTGGAAKLESDLAAYSQNYGIPSCTRANGCLTVVSQTGSTTLPADDGQGFNGWSGETILDVESVHSVCQTCKILLVLSKSADSSSMDTAQAYAASQKPSAISDSWSGSSDDDENQFKFPGIAQFVATGDSGTITDQNSPPDYPEVIAVSGTNMTVNTDGTWASETTWSGSGGGCGSTIAAPSYQTALPNWSTAGCGAKRSQGDISANSGTSGAAAIYGQGNWSKMYGTSLGTPLLAAMYVLANPSPLGSVNTSSIPYLNNTPQNWHDITTGNDCTSRTTSHCTAAAGFDVPTGIGTPKGLGGFKAPDTSSDKTPPSAPAKPTASKTATSVTLTWPASTDDLSGVAGYNILRDGTQIAQSATTSYTDSGLSPGQSYSYTLQAFDVAGNVSAASQALIVSTGTQSDTTPPTTPGTPVSSNVTNSSVTLIWAASTDNVGVTGYTISRNGSVIATTASPIYTDSGLKGGTTYSYTVQATDAAGNISPSSGAKSVTLSAGNGGTVTGCGTGSLAGDINCDGAVDLKDLNLLLRNWTG